MHRVGVYVSREITPIIGPAIFMEKLQVFVRAKSILYIYYYSLFWCDESEPRRPLLNNWRIPQVIDPG